VRLVARSLSAIAANFDAMVEALPMREAMRYKKKNMKWQSVDVKVRLCCMCVVYVCEVKVLMMIGVCCFCLLARVQKYVDAQANAFVEYGLEQGDTIAVWLPECAEKVKCLRVDMAFCLQP
jgi:hypothetical protein